MKYNELHRLLRKNGCYETGKELFGHPAWYSPKTGKYFATSHHGTAEVKPGTLRKILKDAGLK
ncbi:MAG: type II toxin-antitoxin system HicA family toxin [Alloprevotella sp.]|nr:type II toxin-antitoxin system HicA family toxin [Alloprevotella sp.]